MNFIISYKILIQKFEWRIFKSCFCIVLILIPTFTQYVKICPNIHFVHHFYDVRRLASSSH
jgi:hypothetical protein